MRLINVENIFYFTLKVDIVMECYLQQAEKNNEVNNLVTKHLQFIELQGRGGGMHHLGFRCKDVNEEMNRLKSLGLRVITNPQPGEAFENNQIAFLLGNQGLNIELIDTTKKAKKNY